MKKFSDTYDCWPLEDAIHLNITGLWSEGSTVDELIANAEFSIEDWHGNDRCHDWGIEDLPRTDQAEIKKIFTEFLAGKK